MAEPAAIRARFAASNLFNCN